MQDLADSPYPYILITTPLGINRVPLVKHSSWKIGRGKDNNICLPDRSTSRYHAMLQLFGDDFMLIDLGSRNGSFINSRRVITPTALKTGDRITVGSTYIDFYSPTAKTNQDEDSTTSTVDTEMLHKRRLITVLVVDIRDFTRLSQQLDENILSQMIGSWFNHAGQIVSSYGSWVNKYIGDAVMSIWIHNSEDSGADQKNVINSDSQQMLQTFSALRELFIMSNDLNHKFKLPFKLRVGAGINTGYAMVGQMGTSSIPDFTALGDTVNTAFRLESVTKELNVDIALGYQTYGFIPNAHLLLGFKQNLVNLKGYDKRIPIYAGNLADLENFLDNITI